MGPAGGRLGGDPDGLVVLLRCRIRAATDSGLWRIGRVVGERPRAGLRGPAGGRLRGDRVFSSF